MLTREQTKTLFVNLIWPAAAGNVAWSFFTVAIKEDLSDEGVIARVAVLFLLAVYLGCQWLRMNSIAPGGKWYWATDAIHLAAIVVFALAVQLCETWMERPLTIVFVVTFVGHIFGVWDDPTRPKYRWPKRISLAVCSALGMLVLIVCRFREPIPWNLSLAVGLALVAWGCTRLFWNCKEAK